jgi:hypothetical protein
MAGTGFNSIVVKCSQVYCGLLSASLRLQEFDAARSGLWQSALKCKFLTVAILDAAFLSSVSPRELAPRIAKVRS